MQGSAPQESLLKIFLSKKHCQHTYITLIGTWFKKLSTPLGEEKMKLDRMILIFAGFLILGSPLLPQIHYPCWLFFTAFVGANLFPPGFTGFCPPAIFLKPPGVKSGGAV
jgi:hypothetical protein